MMGARGPEDSALITDYVHECLSGFQKACESLVKADVAIKHKVPPRNIKDELGRFRLWCGNIAAHRKGQSSLDYKLREASHIRERVIELLKNLDATIREVTEIIHGVRVPWEDLSDSDSEFLDDDLPLEEPETTELQQLVSNMAEIITCLMRLSMAIRNPAPHDQFKGSTQIDTSYYEPHDIEHVRGKFPHAEEYLVSRLGKAISRRRQYLRYRDEHREKLEQGLERPEVTFAPSERIQSTVASPIPEAMKMSSSTVNLDENDCYEDILSQTSYASSANDATRRRPPPLPEQGQDGEPFECTLCFRFMSVQQVSAWHKHVYRDLQPYVCSFRDCEIPDCTYESRHGWFNHELQSHRKWWECIDGCNRPFQSYTGIREHLQDAHPDWSGNNRLDDLVRTCERQTSMDTEVECALCQQKLASLTQLRRHLGRHHEELALFSLPSYMKDDRDETDDRNGNESVQSALSNPDAGAGVPAASDGLNDARATRVAEIMTDFRNLQHYFSQLHALPTVEEYYLEGYSLLRQCTSEAQSILQTPFLASTSAPAGDAEREKQELRMIITDTAVRRFQCQRAYLRAHAGLRWMNTRNSVLRGQKPNASHLSALQAADNTLRMELFTITDAHVENALRAQDASQGKWLAEDPSLAQIQQILMTR